MIPLSTLVMKCVSRHEEDTCNGPLVTVTLALDEQGSLPTAKERLTFFIHSREELAAYQVGRRFRLTPELLGSAP